MVKFEANISKMGPDKVIIIPRAMHMTVAELEEKLKGKKAVITLTKE